jgi:hypothetical protein
VRAGHTDLRSSGIYTSSPAAPPSPTNAYAQAGLADILTRTEYSCHKIPHLNMHAIMQHNSRSIDLLRRLAVEHDSTAPPRHAHGSLGKGFASWQCRGAGRCAHHTDVGGCLCDPWHLARALDCVDGKDVVSFLKTCYDWILSHTASNATHCVSSFPFSLCWQVLVRSSASKLLTVPAAQTVKLSRCLPLNLLAESSPPRSEVLRRLW